MKKISAFTFLVSVLFMSGARAEVVLPHIFTDNMVVQQKSAVRFHGESTPGSTVTIHPGWSRKPVSVKAGIDGHWNAEMATPEGSVRVYDIRFTDSADSMTVTLNNVAVGEVWLCSGQSNMEMPLAGWKDARVLNYEREIAAAGYPQIRLLHVKRHTSMVPQEMPEIVGDGWMVCSSESVADFSAIGYFYARELWNNLGVPVGVIDCTWGGSPVEAWLSYETLGNAMGFREVVGSFTGDNITDESMRAHYASLLERDKNGGKVVAGADSATYGHKTGFPWCISGKTFYPAELYNAMLMPLTAMTIKGVIWYQGENNGDRAAQYACLFPRMISDWRTLFRQPDMPFYFVQLANWRERKDVQPHSDWGYLRETQASALHLPYTGMAVAIDIGEADNIHPANKQEVARRLSLIALARDYGRKVEYEAPEYVDYTVEGDTAYLTFNATASAFRPVDTIDGFIIAGTEGRFYKADARWAGDRLAVSAPEVQVPVAVRYAWADNPAVSLFGKDGLPVAPFRTDNW